jgi:hypothetical protein
MRLVISIQPLGTRTPTNTNPNGSEANAAGRSSAVWFNFMCLVTAFYLSTEPASSETGRARETKGHKKP